MKSKMKSFSIKLNPKFPKNGSSGSGQILGVSYDTLCKVLGHPQLGEDKTDAEWECEINGKYINIYNWKNGPNYGYHDNPVEKMVDWHVGTGMEELFHKKVPLKEIEFLVKKLGGAFSTKL